MKQDAPTLLRWETGVARKVWTSKRKDLREKYPYEDVCLCEHADVFCHIFSTCNIRICIYLQIYHTICYILYLIIHVHGVFFHGNAIGYLDIRILELGLSRLGAEPAPKALNGRGRFGMWDVLRCAGHSEHFEHWAWYGHYIWPCMAMTRCTVWLVQIKWRASPGTTCLLKLFWWADECSSILSSNFEHELLVWPECALYIAHS